MNFTLYNDDCLNALKLLDDNSIDSCVTDPPYGLSFMGKSWDYDVPSADIWREVLRVLKPGGHLLAFFGSRTYHRGAVQIEDAGFEIRDQIMWIYGSGFPKAGNLKPAHEPIVVARKKLEGSRKATVEKYGTGGLNIEESRVLSGDLPSACKGTGWASQDKKNELQGYRPSSYYANQDGFDYVPNENGRWPANVIHDGSEEVVENFPDSKSCNTPSSAKSQGTILKGARSQGAIYPGEDGSAARFFYCAKASKSDRDEGNNHPTVKPTELMKYLVKLVTQKNGIVLDPFMGSGTTGKACAIEGFKFVGIERDADYFMIAKTRIEHAYQNKNVTLETFFE